MGEFPLPCVLRAETRLCVHAARSFCDGLLTVALTATIYTFDIELSDVDRGVYETLNLRVARHPSETEEYLAVRVLAYCLEHTEGIGFSQGGLSDADEPALAVRDLTGVMRCWIDVGAPDAARLHKASKATERVVVYSHKDPDEVLRQVAGGRIHRAESIDVFCFPPAMRSAFAARLQRRMALSVSVTGGHIYIGIGAELIDGVLRRVSLV
jgi:uncharacterized protein YaeQ